MIDGAIYGAVSGATLGISSAAVSGLFGGEILGGMMATATSGAAAGLGMQTLDNASYAGCDFDKWDYDWIGVGISAAAQAVLDPGIRPYTPANATVTRWVAAGQEPKIESWVQLGGPTRLNHELTGTRWPSYNYPFSNSTTGQISGPQLSYPPGRESVKGLIGQRVVNRP